MKGIIRTIIRDLTNNKGPKEVAELTGGAGALFLSCLGQELNRPIIIITPTPENAESLLQDLNFFAKQSSRDTDSSPGPHPILSMPPWRTLPFEPDSPDASTVAERMRLLYNLTSGIPGFYIIPIQSVMQKLLPWGLFAESVTVLSTGMESDIEKLADGLISLGYENCPMVTRMGEFSRRGGILDVFTPFQELPARLEFFGDRIESIRLFDPETQRSSGEIKELILPPVRELILGSREIEQAQRVLSSMQEKDKIDWLKDLGQGIARPGAEVLAPYLYEMDPLFRYMPRSSTVCIIEPDDIRRAGEDFWRKVVSGREEEALSGRPLPEAGSLYLNTHAALDGLAAFPVIEMRLLPASEHALRTGTKSVSSLGVRMARPITSKDIISEGTQEGTIAGLVEKLRKWSGGNTITIVCATDESRERIIRIFGEYGLSIPFASQGRVTVVKGRLSQGFCWPDLNLIYITEEEIFGRKTHRPLPRRTSAAPFLSTFKELKPGDFVVHRDYGVGEYTGLTHIEIENIETDYLTIRYEPDAKLHVPLYSLDKVQKYIGVEGTTPKIDRLGGTHWAKTKERVKKDLLEMARELASIYAAREAMERPAFSPPDNLYREFESSFPYEETPDQEKAIQDVLLDMQRQRPMDRLVCGDVGYGKTEVALRAAFKAVEDGYQVALLVPTTILADQHTRTFSARLSAFSVKVEMLSRFLSKQEQKHVLKGVKDGIVDIVIGTHRLLQKDVSFRNLGLLIVDEEHRFGVRHKERIREFKRLVDVLTLTATPIPRTLHMSLAGLKDLSIIQTPPMDRQAIQVVLARFGHRVIREAVLQELARGGKVFFVHNRVQGIEKMADFIKQLVPDANIGIAHGRMHEHKIEDVMRRFISGDVNVLVTTTIIESGIDIPEANTIIINRADRFGLAELYQIKGRVGRGREKAFAYLLTPAEEVLSDTARKRLRAIQELSELGAGFRIAARDLETRGAGNILGKQQSGHIAAVGIDLYTEMMEEAVAELQGKELSKELDTQINIQASAFIPDDYISDIGLRLAAYKQVSAIKTEEEAEALKAEFEDRYGPLPQHVRNLIEVMKIKAVARSAMVSRVDAGRNAVNITFHENAKIPADKVMALLRRSKGTVTLASEYTLRMIIQDGSPSNIYETIKKCLQELV